MMKEMKPSALLLLASLLLWPALGWTHKAEKVQGASEALAKLLPDGTAFDAKAFGWEEMEGSGLPKLERLRKLSLGNLETPAGEVHAGYFTVQGDWGEIQAVGAVLEGKVLGVQIVAFLNHKGDMITKPAFLDQFKGLLADGLDKAALKAIPDEPLASEALRAGLMALVQAAEAHEREEGGHSH